MSLELNLEGYGEKLEKCHLRSGVNESVDKLTVGRGAVEDKGRMVGV